MKGVEVMNLSSMERSTGKIFDTDRKTAREMAQVHSLEITSFCEGETDDFKTYGGHARL
jgi:hypothetical protein